LFKRRLALVLSAENELLKQPPPLETAMQYSVNLFKALLAILLVPAFLAQLVVVSPSDGESAPSDALQDVLSAFEAFKIQHGRMYERNSPEHHQRLALFSRRSEEVKQQNARPQRLWTAGINALSDRTDSELAQLRGWKGGATSNRGHSSGGAASDSGNTGTFLRQRGKGRKLPRAFMNWTKLDSHSNVKDQGECGSCWAVATSNVLEAHSEIYKKGRKFSAQEFVDCVPNPQTCGGTGGCAGATIELALHWALNHGVADDGETPYTGQDGSCKKSGGDGLMQVGLFKGNGHEFENIGNPGVHHAAHGAVGPSFGMHGWERLPENSYEPLLHAVVEHGPVAVSVSAGPWGSYSKGIFDGCSRDAIIDHAVTLTGFGEDKDLGRMFWLIQNSWGPWWGEKGYIRLLRTDGEGEFCGIDNQPEVGTACAGGPKEVRVCGMCGILYDTSLPRFT